MKAQCLLIEDDLDDQEIFCMAIQEVDPEIECVFADNGIDGIEILRSSSSFVPDYIFIDLNMPGMNGIDCLREIKKLPHLNASQIIIYSTSVDDKSRTQGSALGVNTFLVKPAGLAQLKEELEGILRINSRQNGDQKS